MGWRYCKGCDQPMLPKGRKKKPFEFDHAQGCTGDVIKPAKPKPRDGRAKA